MVNFILQYWMQVAFGGVVALSGFLYRKLMIRLKEQNEMRVGILAIMQDRLYQGCTHYMLLGQIDIESLRNLEALYNSYNALGGNGIGAELYSRIKSLPIKEET